MLSWDKNVAQNKIRNLRLRIFFFSDLAERQIKERQHQASKLEEKFLRLLSEAAPQVHFACWEKLSWCHFEIIPRKQGRHFAGVVCSVGIFKKTVRMNCQTKFSGNMRKKNQFVICWTGPKALKVKLSTSQHKLSSTLRKQAYSNTLKILPPKNENFQLKNPNIFPISAQNIDCGYSLEPPRQGGSNECPQSMFFAEIRKIIYTPVNPSFTA